MGTGSNGDRFSEFHWLNRFSIREIRDTFKEKIRYVFLAISTPTVLQYSAAKLRVCEIAALNFIVLDLMC